MDVLPVFATDDGNMRTGIVTKGLVEWILTKLGAVPTPFIETFNGPAVARCIVVATNLGIFETLADEPLTCSAIADRIGTDQAATEKLVNVLVSCDYLRFNGTRYSLSRVVRKWLLKSSKVSLRDNMLYRVLEWEAFARIEDFVRSGDPYDVHANLPTEYWPMYQRGMRSLARLSAGEVARRTPLPAEATAMLDVGGSHGLFSVSLCRKYPKLNAVILDLPEAIESAAPLLAEEEMGERVVHRPGDALAEDLGVEAWDLILMSQVVHHFDAPSNRALFRKAARALRPNGVLAVIEMPRPQSPSSTGQIGALLDLMFAATSESGTWSKEELANWQTAAGLTPRRPIQLWTAPGIAIHAAVKDTSR